MIILVNYDCSCVPNNSACAIIIFQILSDTGANFAQNSVDREFFDPIQVLLFVIKYPFEDYGLFTFVIQSYIQLIVIKHTSKQLSYYITPFLNI